MTVTCGGNFKVLDIRPIKPRLCTFIPSGVNDRMCNVTIQLQPAHSLSRLKPQNFKTYTLLSLPSVSVTLRLYEN